MDIDEKKRQIKIVSNLIANIARNELQNAIKECENLPELETTKEQLEEIQQKLINLNLKLNSYTSLL